MDLNRNRDIHEKEAIALPCWVTVSPNLIGIAIESRIRLPRVSYWHRAERLSRQINDLKDYQGEDCSWRVRWFQFPKTQNGSPIGTAPVMGGIGVTKPIPVGTLGHPFGNRIARIAIPLIMIFFLQLRTHLEEIWFFSSARPLES